MGSGLLLAVSPLNDNWNSGDTQFQPENAPDKPVIFMLNMKTMEIPAKESIEYRPLAQSDAESFYQWHKNKDVIKYSLSWFQDQRSIHDFENWLNGILCSQKSYNIGICSKKTGELIGYAGIASISSIDKSGEYFILIGDTKYWGNGIGTEVTKSITSYGFNQLGLHRIFLTVSEINYRAVKVYEKSGYKREGILRDAALRDGEFHNKIVMSFLSTEWSDV